MGAFFVKQLHTLDTFSFSFNELNKEWGCQKRYATDALQRFLLINKRAFQFLDVETSIDIIGNDPYLTIRTSKYAGSVPIMSPKDGRPCGDLCIGGRFGEDISELLSLIEDTLSPEYNETLPSLSSSALEPPIYFECCNFIDKFIDVERSNWHKFDVIEKIEDAPNNGTRWDLYARQSYKPESTLSYTNRSNKLKPLHKEFCQLISVLFLCINEMQKSQTPIRSRIAYAEKIERLQNKYSKTLAKAIPQEFFPHAHDPIAVKEAKAIANIILKNKRTSKRAWRIDYSLFFERFVQFLLGQISRSSASKAICNPHYCISGYKPSWALHYLEPDMIIQKDECQHVIDAKYKSHMFNWNNSMDETKDTFRNDIHQILAYCSFNTMTEKKAMLVYPFSDFAYHKQHLSSPLSRSSADVYLIGIPLVKNKIESVKLQLGKLINEEKENE